MLTKVTLQDIAFLLGLISVTATVVGLALKPYFRLDKTLTRTIASLDLVNDKILDSLSDRKKIKEKVESNDKRLNDHEKILERHSVKIEILEGKKQ